MKQQRPFTLNSCIGFTLLEVLVAMAIASIVVGMGLSMAQTGSRAVLHDFQRTKLNQDMRGAFDIISAEIRQAGENLPTGFAPILLTNGVGANPDTLTLRRNLEPLSLRACNTVSGSAPIVFADNTVAGCGCVNPAGGNDCGADTSILNRQTVWNGYRNRPSRAYIYDSSNQNGEFFTFTDAVVLTSNQATLRRNGNWANTYTPISAGRNIVTTAYILDEYRISLNPTHILQIAENNSATPFNIAPDITNFQVSITMRDNTSRNSFDPSTPSTPNWKQIKFVNITLTGTSNGVTSTLSGTYLPRNVLSESE